MRASALLLLGVLALPLGACGFTPLYAEHTGVSQALSSFRIETGTGRGAYLLRQQLVDRFGARNGEDDAVYVLEAQVRETRGGSGIRPDDVVTRYQITMQVSYQVRRISDGERVHRGVVSGTSAFDATGGPYSDVSVEERARERAAGLAADRVRLDLSLHFAGINGG